MFQLSAITFPVRPSPVFAAAPEPRPSLAAAAATAVPGRSPSAAIVQAMGPAPAAIRIEDIVKEARVAMRGAGEVLRQRLAEHGIDASPPVDIGFDGAGRAIVGEHPRQQEIRQLIEQDPELEATLRDAFCLGEQAVSWQKAERFQLAYAATWQAHGQLAADRLHDLFMAMREPRNTLRLGPEGLDIRFGGLTGDDHLAGVMKSLGLTGRLVLDTAA